MPYSRKTRLDYKMTNQLLKLNPLNFSYLIKCREVSVYSYQVLNSSNVFEEGIGVSIKSLYLITTLEVRFTSKSPNIQYLDFL